MKKVYKSILAATIALSTTMSIVTGFAANNDKEKNQENNSAITYNAGNEIKPDVQVLSDNGTQLTKGVDYDPKKMVSDIRRPAVYLQAA